MREHANDILYYLSSKRHKELYKQTFEVVFFSIYNLSTGNVRDMLSSRLILDIYVLFRWF